MRDPGGARGYRGPWGAGSVAANLLRDFLPEAAAGDAPGGGGGGCEQGASSLL